MHGFALFCSNRLYGFLRHRRRLFITGRILFKIASHCDFVIKIIEVQPAVNAVHCTSFTESGKSTSCTSSYKCAQAAGKGEIAWCFHTYALMVEMRPVRYYRSVGKLAGAMRIIATYLHHPCVLSFNLLERREALPHKLRNMRKACSHPC